MKEAPFTVEELSDIIRNNILSQTDVFEPKGYWELKHRNTYIDCFEIALRILDEFK